MILRVGNAIVALAIPVAIVCLVLWHPVDFVRACIGR